MASSSAETFNPILQLRDLLGPRPKHPWGALLPQVILWCFRRFCVGKLMAEQITPLTDQVWDDYLELLGLYAPKGLECAASEWFIPEAIEHLHSSLEDYTRYFLDCLECIDTALETDDPDMQDQLSQFLDVETGQLIQEWIGPDMTQFFIFPLKEEDDDEFPQERLMTLIQSLLAYSPTSTETDAVSQPEPSVPEPAEPPVEPPVPAPTIAAALAHRRKTFCSRPRDRSTRGKTRKLHPRP